MSSPHQRYARHASKQSCRESQHAAPPPTPPPSPPAKWALGAAGTGAPVHFHNTAWNALLYGTKHWYVLPPSHNLMGKMQASSNYYIILNALNCSKYSFRGKTFSKFGEFILKIVV